MGNIYLIGMMGSGKTATGNALRKLLNCEFVDFDKEIRRRSHGDTIAKIFEVKGEEFFRDQETAVLRETPAAKFLVAGTGGGIVLRSENVEQMKSRGTVVYLEASLDTLWQRVRRKEDRPLLHTENPKETLNQILKSRMSLYEAACHFKVNTDGKSPAEVAKIIYDKLEKQI